MSYEENVELDDPLEVLPYKDAHLGRVYIPGSKENTVRFISDFRATDVGVQIKKQALDTGQNLDKILEATQAETGREEVYLSEYVEVAKRLWLIGDLEKKRKPAPAIDNVERDSLGRPLSAKAKQWKIWTEWCNLPTTKTAQIAELRRTDDKFREFYEAQSAVERTSTPVESGIILNQKSALTTKTIPRDVLAFAERYRTMSADAIRKELSPGINPLGPTAAAEANRLFQASCAAGLI